MMETFIPTSTRIDRVDYDGDQNLMTITFKDGRAYEYPGVPLTVFIGLQHAKSAGQYFERQIKSRFPASEV